MAHTTDLNETDLMSAVGFLTLPFQLRPDPLVWRILHAENVAALARGRKPFSYVDLTAKELLPLWLAPDTIGGKTPAGADWGAVLDPNTPASNLAQLGRALQGATASKKFFRTHSQWQAAFNKYCVAAISLKQISWDPEFAYEDVLQVFFSWCCTMISFVVNVPGAHWQVNQSWTSTNVSSHVIILSWKRHVFDSRPFWSLLVWYQHPRHWQRPLSLPVVLM